MDEARCVRGTGTAAAAAAADGALQRRAAELRSRRLAAGRRRCAAAAACSPVPPPAPPPAVIALSNAALLTPTPRSPRTGTRTRPCEFPFCQRLLPPGCCLGCGVPPALRRCPYRVANPTCPFPHHNAPQGDPRRGRQEARGLAGRGARRGARPRCVPLLLPLLPPLPHCCCCCLRLLLLLLLRLRLRLQCLHKPPARVRACQPQGRAEVAGWRVATPDFADRTARCGCCSAGGAAASHALHRHHAVVPLAHQPMLQRPRSPRTGTTRRTATGRRPPSPTPSARTRPAAASGSAPPSRCARRDGCCCIASPLSAPTASARAPALGTAGAAELGACAWLAARGTARCSRHRAACLHMLGAVMRAAR